MTAPTIDRADLATRIQQAAETLAAIYTEIKADCPDGLDLAMAFDAQLGVCVDALPRAVATLNAGPLYVAPDAQIADLVDCPPVYYTTADLNAAWEDGWTVGLLGPDAPLTAVAGVQA